MKNFISKLFAIGIAFFAFVLLFDIDLSAQNVAAWHDRQGRFQYYDDGKFVQLDHNPVGFFKLGHDFILYFNSQDEMVYYRKGQEEELHLRDVKEDYAISRHLIMIKVGGLFTVIDHKKNQSLSLQDNPRFEYGDSIVAFIDYYGGLKAFYDGGTEVEVIDPFSPLSFKTSETSIAFVDNDEQLQFHIDGETILISDAILDLGDGDMRDAIDSLEYKPGNDFLLFEEEYNEFYIYRNNELNNLSKYPPKSYKVGRNIAAYVDDQENFFLIKEGEIEPTEIAPNEPAFYDVVDNTMVFVDQNSFNVYYKGKIHNVEPYIPASYQYADGVVAYTDDNGRLKAFYEGKVVNVSTGIVSPSRDTQSANGLVNTSDDKFGYAVYGRVILYQYGDGDYHIFHNGEEVLK